MTSRGYFASLDRLVEVSDLIVDRPRGSRHPRFPEVVYPVDYGYLAGTAASDGAGIDVFRGSLPLPTVQGVLLTADLGKRDVEVKLLLGCTPDELTQIRALVTDALGIGGHLVERPSPMPAGITRSGATHDIYGRERPQSG